MFKGTCVYRELHQKKRTGAHKSSEYNGKRKRSLFVSRRDIALRYSLSRIEFLFAFFESKPFARYAKNSLLVFWIPVILERKDLHHVGTNAQVSGMRSLHADTSADLSKRERPRDVNFSF